MTAITESKRVRDLQRLLEQVRVVYGELFAVIDAKLGAMKRADVAALTELSAKEIALVQRLTERETLRGQLMDAIGGELGLTARAGRSMTISQLADRLAEPERGALLQTTEGLRAVLLKVMQANRVCGAVSLELLNHLRWVLAAVRPRDEKPNVYSGNGAFVGGGASALLELVG